MWICVCVTPYPDDAVHWYHGNKGNTITYLAADNPQHTHIQRGFQGIHLSIKPFNNSSILKVHTSLHCNHSLGEATALSPSISGGKLMFYPHILTVVYRQTKPGVCVFEGSVRGCNTTVHQGATENHQCRTMKAQSHAAADKAVEPVIQPTHYQRPWSCCSDNTHTEEPPCPTCLQVQGDPCLSDVRRVAFRPDPPDGSAVQLLLLWRRRHVRSAGRGSSGSRGSVHRRPATDQLNDWPVRTKRESAPQQQPLLHPPGQTVEGGERRRGAAIMEVWWWGRCCESDGGWLPWTNVWWPTLSKYDFLLV